MKTKQQIAEEARETIKKLGMTFSIRWDSEVDQIVLAALNELEAQHEPEHYNQNIPATCRACERVLVLENLFVDDGCPCNSPRGVNFTPQRCDLCKTDNCVKPGHRIKELFGVALQSCDSQGWEAGSWLKQKEVGARNTASVHFKTSEETGLPAKIKISNYRPFAIIGRDPDESTYERGDNTFTPILHPAGSFNEQKRIAEHVVNLWNRRAPLISDDSKRLDWLLEQTNTPLTNVFIAKRITGGNTLLPTRGAINAAMNASPVSEEFPSAASGQKLEEIARHLLGEIDFIEIHNTLVSNKDLKSKEHQKLKAIKSALLQVQGAK